MSAIRERARGILSAIPQGEIRSNDGTGNYTKYTGLTQAAMEANWKTGGKLTGCNGFTGWYAATLGSEKYIGRFDLETYLPKIGKGDAWVKSKPGLRPQYGDILLHTHFHVDVALDFDGDILTRMAAGQGGRSRGCDVLCRVRGKEPYNSAKLAGWVDIDLYFGSTPGAGVQIPNWLPGWWKVMWRGQAYYYYFDRYNRVKWTQQKPANISVPPSLAKDTGNVAVEGATAISIRWGATGSVEKLAAAATTSQMNGTWNDRERLDAVKM